jgi:putative endonuclease
MKMHYVYIVECKDGTLYTGYTVDLEKRMSAHNDGKGAKYTRGRLPIVLKYFEEYNVKNDALKREIKIKSYNKSRKLKLIKNN